MKNKKSNKFIVNLIEGGKPVIMFSRLVRWAFGALFIAVGLIYFKEGGWPAILFGAVIFITGFFRPARCLGGSCAFHTQKDY